MSTVIYLSNQQIQVVTGTAGTRSISVKQSYTVTAPEGSIINGMIMDVGLFSSFLKSFWEETKLPKKDVILVVDSTKFIGRTIEVPALKDSKILQFVEREYADMGRDEEMVYSFIHIADAEGKKKKIYAEGIAPEFIKDFVDIFGEIGIKLSAIYSGESSLITFTGQTAARSYSTFVLLVADKVTLTTVLWVNGSFYYYNSARCFHDPGTPEYAADIARSMSQLSQFMQANQIEYRLQSIQIAGVNYEDKPMYTQAIADLGIDTPVQIFNFKTGGGSVIDPTLQNYLHAVSGLYIGDKTENFLPQFVMVGKNKKNAENEEKTKNILTVCTVLLVMIAIFFALFFVRLSKKNQLDSLKDYNQSPEVQMQTMRYDILTERNNYLLSQFDAIKGLSENAKTYPAGNKKVLSVFDKCAQGYAEVSYESFDAKSGTITIRAKAENVEEINKFIKKLTEQDMFCRVDYTGYVYDSTTEKWDILVTCTLAEAAGR